MKIHPLTIIIFGLLLISLFTNYSQYRRYFELKEEIKNTKTIIIIPKNTTPVYQREQIKNYAI